MSLVLTLVESVNTQLKSSLPMVIPSWGRMIFLGLSLLIAGNTYGQSFSDVTAERWIGDAVAITEVSSLWADINNDGNLDLIYSGLDTLGLPISGVYVNSGSPDYQLSRLNSGGIPGLKSAAIAAGDVDNDGDIDILISGETFGGSFVTDVYKNDGSGAFSSTFDLEGTSRGAIALGDFDNDGDLDAVISGESASGIYAEVYVNNGNGRMNQSQTLTGLVDGDIDLGDFDADGDLDIAICGASTLAGGDPKLLIYRQDASGDFAEFSSLEGFVFADLEWADLNLDGFLELLVAGATNSAKTEAQALAYTYSSVDEAFDATNLGIKLVDARVSIGDYTNDGLSDVLITGDNIDDPADPKPSLLLLKNGSVTNLNAALDVSLEVAVDEFVWTSELAGIQRDVKWADINNDQNLDFISLTSFITAGNDTFETFVLFESAIGADGLDLEEPTNVTLTQDESTLILSWEDNANGGEISYQIGLGDEAGNYNIISPNYVSSTGTRTLAQRGQFSGPKSVEIEGLDRGDYFAIVQAIGANFEISTSKEAVGSLSAPEFKEVSAESFPGGNVPAELENGDVAFADVNNDGAQDLVVAGTSTISLYLNDGNGSFSPQPGLPDISAAQLEFGDLNLDGALDIMIFGFEGADYKWLAYQGNNAGEFSLLQSGTVDNATEATGKLGDLNGDGSLDFILSGSVGGAPFTRLFQNTGGSFSAVVGGGIAPMANAAIALADFNKDGWIDAFLSGEGEDGDQATLYAGQGGFDFVEVKADITALQQGNAEWGDYDSDGDLDLLLSGNTGGGVETASAAIYSPDGDGVYQASTITLPAVNNGEVKWADYNEDGFLDLLLAGRDKDSGEPSTRLFRYDQGSNSFLPSPDNSLTFQGVLNGQVAWGFANNDLKIDFALLGLDAADASVFKLYLNEEESSNFTPGTPNDLTSNVGDTEISLGWNPPSGSAARVEGFSYNLYVGNTENTADISSPPANLNTDFHKIAQLGGQMGRYNLERSNFTEGTYFWGVQAIDQDFEGGEFAAGTFTILGPDFTDVTEATQLSATSLTKAALAWGDYGNDGDLDVFVMGESDGNPSLAFYVNQGNGTFAAKDIGISGLVNGDVAFWDLNGDRTLDIIMSGESGGAPQTQIYTGNDDGTFTELSSTLPAVSNSSLSVGDFDRDGDQDLLIAGITQDDSRITAVYENQGNGSFEALAGLAIPGVNAAVSWIDVDDDGLLDIFVSGEGSGGAVAELHLNQGDKTFEKDNTSTLTPVINSNLDIGDIDNDGDTDLIVSGDASGTFSTIIYENDGGSLKEKQRLTGLSDGAIAFGDLNNDRFIDAIISGQTQSGDLVTQLFINSAGTFSQSLINSDFFTGLSATAVALGDFDQDAAKDLDILLAGSLPTGESLILYQNDFDASFTAPGVPSNLDFSIQGSKANLKWDEPSSSQSDGFQYNIQIEIDGETNELAPSLSNQANGFRKIVGAGNIGQSTVTELNGLIPGQTYSFQVQSIDQAFRGSAFSSATEFTVQGLPLVEEFETVFDLPKTGFSEATLSLVDVDNDGDLDVVGIGADENGVATSFILVNTISAGTGMTRQNLPLGLKNGDIAAADVDNDGDVDLFLTGDNGANPQAVLYLNNGSGLFTASTSTFVGLLGGEAEWADLDNDGDVDLVYHGNDGTDASTLVYLNQLSDGTFNPLATGFPDVESGALSLEDIDNDGWVDVLLTGSSGTELLSTVAINNGDLTFSQDTGELPGLRDASLAGGDIDNDGDMDFFISGNESLGGNTLLTELYLNNGNGDFQKSTVDFPDVSNGRILLLDIDLDGKRDLLIQGVGTGNLLELWNNETLGNSISFEKNDASSSLFPALGGGSGIAIGDLNANSTPDFLLTGISDQPGAGPEWYFLSNEGAEGNNTTPAAPEGLASSTAGSAVQLSWKDDEDGSTYNLYVGTASGQEQIKAAASNIANGTRRLVANGNVGHSSSTSISGLAPATYYWGVQKIDQDGEGSEFSDEGTFEVEPPFFEEVTATAFESTPEGVQNGALSWGDYQNDGDLDLLVTGSRNGNPSTQLFVNDGSGVFQEVNAGLVNVEAGDAVFFDGNSDGILDLIILGNTTSNPITVYYEGAANGTFVEKQSLTGLRNSSASVRDFDRDGDPDLILAGINSAGDRLTSLFRNEDAVFEEVSDLSLPGVNANISWWDYNNDGNPDILITGSGEGGPLTALYENVGGSGAFTEVPDLGIPGVENSSVSIGDYDNDGDEDVLISGSVGAEYITRLYRNDDGTISASIGFEGLRNGSTAFGDYNHDGFLDVLLTGENEEGETFGLLYINNNGTAFNLDLTNSPILTDVTLGQAAFADFDNDANGTLDIVMMGTDNLNSSLSLFKNNTVAPNSSPAVPTNLSSSQQGNSLVLSWDRPSGANSEGYSFNILLRDQDTGELIFSSQSAANGLRMVPEMGNAGHRTSMAVSGINLGNYEWTVQSVDQGLEGSAFAPLQTLNFIPLGAIYNPSGIAFEGVDASDVEWTDLNGDGAVDIILIGENAADEKIAKVYLNDGISSGSFSESNFDGDPGIGAGSISVGDYDNDGDIDVLIVGDDGDFSTTIFNNDGNGKLSDSNIPFEGLKNGDGIFGDYDNDGDLDVLITGESNGGPFTQLYQNTAGSFAPVSTSLPIAENSKVAFGDFDNDGDLDVVMKGVVVIGVNRGLFARVYLNDGAGDFPDVKILPSTIVTGSISLGDINNDGDLDILMTGSTAETGGQRRSTIFNNDGAANFSATNLPAGVINGEGKFADINNDGWLDAVITGEESANFSSRVYLNNGSGTLGEDGSNSVILLGLAGGSSIAFGDYNGDGKLDLFQAGLTNAPTSAESSALFTNIDPTANISPTAPSSVASSQNGAETTFSWSQLALAGEQAAGYSYNLYITTDPGGAIINPPHADISSGARRVVENGSIQETTWTINNLPAGFYNWGVQSVDQNYEGSAFATGSFSVQDPSFEDISTLFGANRTVGMEDPAAAWIDHNQDGRLDLILAGETSSSGNTELFINTVSGFQEVITNLDDVSDATISLTDFNLDNRTDVFISGVDGANKVSQLYQGGPGSIDFTKVTTGIQGVSGGSSDWADFNLDGLPDLLLTGLDEDDQPVTTIYQNLGGGVFNEISAGLTDIQDGEAKWLDYNNDLLPDVILSGTSDGGSVTELFRGNGDGSFTKIGVAFSTFTRATIGIADINNDGFVDLVISGNGEGGADLAIYVNANGTTFSENAQALTEVVSSSLDLADIDEDGDVDMIVTGQIQGGNASTILYLNDGSGSFTEDIANIGTFPNVHRGVIKFADFNSDGKLDLYLAGNENVGSSNFNSFLFQNILPTTDQVPAAPTNPASNQAGNTVNISWEAPTNVDNDEEDAIRYNFYLSRNPGYGSTGLFSPLANVGSGAALVPDISNTGTGLTRSFSDLTPGTYYWGVQAIDQGLDRSTFTTEQSFTYIPAGAAFLDETPSLISGLVGGWSQAEVSTADIDNDDDLDFIISGINSSGDTEIRVYIFTGSSFVLDDDLTDGLTAVANPSIEWQDVNGDGFLDVLIAGLSPSGPISILYENEDGDEFSQLATFLGVNASVAWGDYDNDGRSDLLLTGQSTSGPVSILYHNDGGGAFTEVTAVNLTGVQESSVLWSDVNTDGYKDIVLTGNDGSAPTTLIYINDQAGNFTSIGNGGLANIKLGDIEEGDYNNDGLPDFVLAGESGATGFTPVAGVYRNNGDQTFTQVFAPTASREGSVAWGDYNNDGFKDFVVIGKETSANNTYSSRFYTNNGGTSFTEDVANSAVLPNLGDGATLSWGDLNDDDKLDLILSGRSTDVPPANIFSILTNIDANANTTLNAPTGLTASQTGTTVEVSWAAPTGVAANLIDGITYNLRIGSSSGDIDILTPLTDATTGFNRVPQSGSLGNTLTWTINGLSEGQYFWSVQAVDQDFETSAFSTESQFQVIAPDFTDASSTVIPGIPANVDLRNGNIYWLDFNNDSELDFIVTGENISNPLITVFENSGGVLNQSSSVATDLVAVTNAELDAADFDKDGDLDVLITGTNASSNGLTSLYSYDQGQAKFVVETAISNVLDNVTDGDISWGDYDNDGDLDILLAGNAGTPILRLYENDGLGNFSEDDQSGVLVGIEDAKIAWIDLDTDGDLDIVANGSNGTEARTYLYSNNGAGIYTNISDADIIGTIQGDLAFADIENDGDLDLVISGLNFTQTTSSTTLYVNDGSGDFANSGQAFMPSANGSLAFGDYNDDTFPDLIITGFSAVTDSSVIYDNTNGTFALNPVNSGLFPKIGQGGVSWADYDRDGKIDLAFTGRIDASASYVLRIFENNNVNSNTTPDEPENLVVSIINDDITLNWQPPAGASNPDGLSYALYLESVSDGEYIIRPNAFIQGGNSGIRKTVSIGNVGQQSSFTISGLPAGDYAWSVQAIDQDFEGSIFAPEQTLTYQPAGLIFFDQSVNALPGNVEGLDQASLALADVNDDGFLDFVVSGEEDDGDLITEYYEFDAGDNEFDKITAISNELDNVKNGSLDWGDLNNDGLPDLVLTGDGSTNANVNPQTRLYENNGSGFTEITFGAEDVVNGDAIFGDYNNDGLQDIFITGSDGANGVSELFQNVDGSSFIEVPTNIASLTESSADWGDYNNDGFLDLALMGSGNGGPVSFIYRNNGDGTFTGINVDLADVKQGDIKWVDIDNDQDLDLIMCGEQSENGTNLTTSLYLNEGNGNFSLSGSSMTGVREGNLSLGDINQDTYPDLILTGKSGAAAESRVTEVYLNNGTGTLIQDNVNSQNILSTDNGAFVALGDVLQDRRLDLLVVGRTNAGPETKTFKLYQNITTNALTNPATPTNLIAVQEGNEIVFSWTQAGDTDQSYNLYVGSGANSQDAKSSLSVIDGANEGYRKVLKSGNVGFTSTWRINSLASGTYEWGVQAIDQDLEGTAFIEGPPITYVAPDFEELQASFIAGGNLPAYSEATMAWGDFDNDEDLDLVIAGADGSVVQTRLYRNDLSNNNQFTLLGANLPGVKNGDIEWIDIENDGDLDLIITGESALSAPVTRILVNDGSSGGSFSLIPTPAVPQTINSSIAVGDINNDGAQDFVVTGFSQSGRVSEVFLNQGGSFTSLNAGLTPIDEGTVVMFDADRDGKLDILLSGNSDGAGLVTELYIQTQDLTFRRKVLDLPGLENGSIDWADFDLDGFHDIVLTGVSGPNRIGRVYSFNQADTTYQFFAGIDSVQNGYASWGDFNEDGFTDIILTGQNGNFGTDRTTVLYRNNNGVGFVEEAINSQLFQDLNNGSTASWADINTDGRLDVVMAGTALGSSTNGFHIYTNQLAGLEADVVPTPINLSAVQDGFDIVISWDPATTVSDETTYELIVGTSSGGQEIRSGLSDPATGFRRVPVPGELTSTFSYRLTDISFPGEIFFGLQAIENDFETSPFEEESITFIRPDFTDETSTYFSSVPPLRVEDAGIAWGDVFDQNGSDFLDLFITGATDSVPTAYLYANNGLNNSFTLLTDTLVGVRNASAAWGDLNNDGNLDLLYAGEDVDGNPLTKLYASVGNSLVDISATAELEDVKNGDVYWVDYDNDGDQDIFLTGESATGPSTKLYENLEGNAFRDISLPQTLALRNSSVDWADYDGNGLMDLAIMGERNDGTPFTDVFRNIGNGTFESVSTGIENVSNGDIKWGDFNNDGRVDLAIMGLDETGQPFSAVYRLDLLVFTPITITGLPGMSAGSIEFVDFDNDGYRDLIFSGSTGSGPLDRQTILLKNNNSGGFFVDNINSSALTDADHSTIEVADIDLDGKVDILLAGRADNGSTSFLTTRLFANITSANATVPLSPSNANMTATVDTDDPDRVTLSWTAPAAPSGLDGSVVNGYTYNIYLLRDGTLEATPLSDIVAPSNRRVVRSGNTSQNLSWEIDGLPSGTYSWSVQAVDQDYQGSVFTQGADPFVIDAPIFADVTNSAISALPGIGFSESSLDWGDYDNDGDLDLLISGEVTDVVGGVSVGVPTSKVLENLGNGIFDDVTDELGVALIQVRKSIVSWGDFNSDGNLDFFISGEQVLSGLTNEINNIYKGDGTGNFTILDNLNIVPVASGDAEWGDYDNDGDLDIAVMGSAQSTGANSAIYRNNGDETFNRITIPVNVGSGELAWGDYDGDRDLDLFISGFTGTVPFTRLIDNNNGIFQALEVIPNGLQLGSIDLGDYDNDGDIDLLITGKTTNRSISSVYRNDGTLPFVDIGAPLDSVAEGRGIFGDYNDDGLLDIFLIGSDQDGNRIAKLYQNDSTSVTRFEFDQPASTTLVGADEDAYAAWGDFDGDDKLDLVVTGLEFESNQGVKFRALRFYKNNEETLNGFPSPPTGLTQTLDGNVIQFLWSAPEQYIFPGVDTTDVAGRSFSYNLLLGSVETGEVEIISPMADTANGYRRVVRQGNVGYDFGWEVEGLDAGDYFWSVQAIDADFEGSEFPEPLQFTFIPTSFEDVTDSEFPLSQLPQRVENAAVNFGDFDNDEDLDILISGRLDDENFATRLYEYDSGYQINQAASDSLVDLRQAAAEWGDYDSDGDLDIFLVGQNQDLEEIAIIYENVSGTFIPRPSVSGGIIPVDLAAAKFGDYDNDGDLDLFVAGRDRTTLNIRSDIYENVLNSSTDERTFVRNVDASATLVGIENGSVDWGDYNKDSFLDLVIAGEAASGPLAAVYRNTGNRTFIDDQQPLTPIKDGSVSWGDYNNDGFLDILLAGENTSSSFRPASRIFRYDDDGKEFQDIVQGMEDVRNSSVSWADFDNDGYLDFFLLGERRNSEGDPTRTSSIYRGRPNDDFIQDLGSSQTIADFNFPNGLWGDYNGDGRIDLLLTGVDDDQGTFGFALYRNNVGRAPIIPDPVTGLVDDPQGDEVILSWDVPANYVGEFENSPTYNIALGPRGGSIIEVISPMADTLSGVRTMVRLGNAGHRAQWVLKELPDGFYCWSVQALAENYQGGAFSDTSCFNYINPRPVIEVEDLPTLVRYRDETTDTTAAITVRDTLVVDRVELNYKGISETSWRKEPATKIPGTNTYAVDIEAGLNRSSIPDFNLTTDREIGIEYYLVVLGKFGTPIRFTDTSTLTRAYLRFDSLGLVNDISIGREVSAYNIISVPLELDDPSVKATLRDDFGDYDVFNWRFWYYDALGNRQEYDSTASLPLIEPGIGYWLIYSPPAGAINTDAYDTGAGNTVKAYADSPFVWTLTPGHNQIGNPYHFDLSWNEIIEYNKIHTPEIPADSLDKLDLNTFEQVYQMDDEFLQRNEGAFVYTSMRMDLKVPVTKNLGIQTERSGSGADFPERYDPIDATNWMVDIRLRKGEIPSWLGAIGMNKTAIFSYDKHDVIAPPRSFGYAEFVSYHPEYENPRFGVDVVPTQESYVWDMVLEQVDAEDPVIMEWDPSYFGNGDKELILYDVEKQKPVDMRMINQYVSWSSSVNRQFRIYYGTQAFIDSALSPDVVLLGAAYPNPASEVLNIPFTLPPSSGLYEVKLDMYNTLGQKLFTLFEGRLGEGFHEERVELNHPSGEQLSNGVYIYKLTVKGRDESYEQVKRFVIRK